MVISWQASRHGDIRNGDILVSQQTWWYPGKPADMVISWQASRLIHTMPRTMLFRMYVRYICCPSLAWERRERHIPTVFRSLPQATVLSGRHRCHLPLGTVVAGCCPSWFGSLLLIHYSRYQNDILVFSLIRRKTAVFFKQFSVSSLMMLSILQLFIQ
jgi:hypothetical protein